MSFASHYRSVFVVLVEIMRVFRKTRPSLTLVFLAVPLATWGQDWGAMATVSSTMGIQGGRLCLGEASRGDIGCPVYAPSVTTAGHVSVTGNLSAAKFIGDGSGLTGLSGNGDRITSGTSSVTVQSGGVVSITTNGTTANYFNTSGLLITPGISVTTTNGISSTNGYFSGRIGLGIAPSTYGFQLEGDGGASDDVTFDGYSDTVTNSPLLQIRRGRGASGAATAVQANDTLGLLRFAGHNGVGFTNGVAIGAYVEGDFSTTATRNASLRFSTVNANSFAERMRINPDGKVGIGTTTPKATLEVSGSISLGSGALYMPYNAGTDFLANAYAGLMAASANADSSLLIQTDATDVGLSNQETVLMLADAQTNNDDGFSIVRWNANGFHSIPFRMSGNGNIGMGGMLAPTQALDVSGTVRATKFMGDGSSLTNLTGDDLGNHTATTTIKATNGTVALPAYTWAGDTNTGFYWVGADQIGATVGGVQQLLIRTTGLTISGSVLVNNVGDTAAAPSYSWSGDTNTGFYWAGADNLAATTGGTQRLLVNGSGLRVTGYVSTTGVIDAGAAIYGYQGDSVTAPGYTWSGDTNTGMYWVGADQIGLTVGGIQQLLVRSSGIVVSGSVLVNNVGDTAAAPSYSWSGDTNTGFYWVASDQIGVTTGGTQRVLVNSSGLTVTGRVSTTGLIDAGGQIYGYQGDSVTAPGYTWSGDTHTGMYWVGNDQIGLSVGGVQQMLIRATGVVVSGSVLVNNVGDTAAAPSYSWSGDTNTGIYWVGADQIGFTAGGTQRLRVHTTGATVTGALTASGDVTGAAFLYSSDKRLKTNIRPLEPSLEKLERINSYRFAYRNDPSRTEHIGVMAQEVAEVYPEAVRKDDQGMLRVDYPALVPALIKSIQELDARVKELEHANDNLQKGLSSKNRGARS